MGLQAAVRALISDKAFAGGAVAIEIFDMASGQILAAVNEHMPLNPASNAKLYTAGAALAKLHGDHQYFTSVTGEMRGEDATSLALHGYGDPSLTSSHLWGMVQDLKASGLRR